MKTLNIYLLKEILLDITILLISVFFIEIGLLCWLSSCFSDSISPNFVIIFFVFIYIFKHICIYFFNL